MLILAIDTSWKRGGIALARGDGSTFELLDSKPLAGGTFSAQLVPQAASLLSKQDLSQGDLDGFAAASGPGSFTGLRVGLAAIKGLAEALGKPIAAVSVLEAMALAAGVRGRVIAVLDAGRGEVYVGEYEADSETWQATSLRENVLAVDDFLASAAGSRVIAADETLLDTLRGRGVNVMRIARPGADWMARIGIRKILCGETVSPEVLDANYIRRSDAELFSLPKRS